MTQTPTTRPGPAPSRPDIPDRLDGAITAALARLAAPRDTQGTAAVNPVAARILERERLSRDGDTLGLAVLDAQERREAERDAERRRVPVGASVRAGVRAAFGSAERLALTGLSAAGSAVRGAGGPLLRQIEAGNDLDRLGPVASVMRLAGALAQGPARRAQNVAAMAQALSEQAESDALARMGFYPVEPTPGQAVPLNVLGQGLLMTAPTQLPAFAVGAIGGPVGVAGAAAYMAALDTAGVVDETRRAAIERGQDPADANALAAGVGAAYGPASAALERLGLGGVLRAPSAALRPTLRTVAARYARRVAEGAISEAALNELPQQVLGDTLQAWAANDWDGFRETYTDSSEPARVAITAAVMGGAVSGAAAIPAGAKDLASWRAAVRAQQAQRARVAVDRAADALGVAQAEDAAQERPEQDQRGPGLVPGQLDQRGEGPDQNLPDDADAQRDDQPQPDDPGQRLGPRGTPAPGRGGVPPTPPQSVTPPAPGQRPGRAGPTPRIDDAARAGDGVGVPPVGQRPQGDEGPVPLAGRGQQLVETTEPGDGVGRGQLARMDVGDAQSAASSSAAAGAWRRGQPIRSRADVADALNDAMTRQGRTARVRVAEPANRYHRAMSAAAARLNIEAVFVRADGRARLPFRAASLAREGGPGIIAIDADAPVRHSLLGIVLHEAVHDVRAADAQAFAQITGQIRRRLPDAWAQAESAARLEYEASGLPLPDNADAIDEETLATVVENVFGRFADLRVADRQAFSDAVNAAPTAFARVLHVLQRMLRAVGVIARDTPTTLERQRGEIDAARLAEEFLATLGRLTRDRARPDLPDRYVPPRMSPQEAGMGMVDDAQQAPARPSPAAPTAQPADADAGGAAPPAADPGSQPRDVGPDLGPVPGVLRVRPDQSRDGPAVAPDAGDLSSPSGRGRSAPGDARRQPPATDAGAPGQLTREPTTLEPAGGFSGSGLRALVGRRGAVRLPDATRLDASYAVVSAADLIPSHDARHAFAANQNADVNERRYDDPREGRASRATVEAIAADPDPDLLTTDTPSAVDGPPMTAPTGQVLGGNARTMAVQLAYARGGAAARRLRLGMIRAAERFGVSPDAVADMDDPVLVRVLDRPGDPGELSRVLNEALTTAKPRATDAVSRAAKVSDRAVARLSNLMAGTGADDDAGRSLRDLMADPDAMGPVLQQLYRDGAWTDADITRYQDPQTQALNEAGKDTIEQMMLGRLIPDAALMSTVRPAAKRNLLAGLSSILQTAADPATDIRAVVLDAVRGFNDFKASKLSAADFFFRQSHVQPPPGYGDAAAASVAHGLDALGPSQFRAAVTDYLERMGQASDDSPGFGFAVPGQAATRGEALLAAFGEHPAKPAAGLRSAALASGASGISYAPAWHGSPHRFDRFDIGRIGTGEGAQAFGWGLYFAEKRDVATYYKNLRGDKILKDGTGINTLDGEPLTAERWREIAGRIAALPDDRAKLDPLYPLWLDVSPNDLRRTRARPADTLRHKLKREADDYRNAGADFRVAPPDAEAVAEYEAQARRIEALLPRLGYIEPVYEQRGTLYRVTLTPDDAEWLLWDTPLRDMPEPVRGRLAALMRPVIGEGTATVRPDRTADGDALADDIDDIIHAEAIRSIGRAGGNGSPAMTARVAIDRAIRDAIGTGRAADGGFITAGELADIIGTPGDIVTEAVQETLSRTPTMRYIIEADVMQSLDGQTLYKELARAEGSERLASLALRAAGVPGIKFLDGSSRGRNGPNTFNYVVFDDTLVRVDGRDPPDPDAGIDAIRFAPAGAVESDAFRSWFGASVIRDQDGAPRVLYHETRQENDAAIGSDGFDIGRVGARAGDDQVPDGVFLKPTPRPLGLGGSARQRVQIPLYARLENPLVVADREALEAWARRASDAYARARDRVIELETAAMRQNERDEVRLEAARKATAAPYRARAAATTDAERARHDAEYERLNDAYAALLDEIEGRMDVDRERANAMATVARAHLTAALRGAGHDGVHLQHDRGSLGRSVETYIVLRPSQVKHATENVGTFDPDRAGVRFAPADRPDDGPRDLFGARTFDAAATGRQLPMFGRAAAATSGDTREGESAIAAEVRRRQEADARRIGNDPDQMLMFAPRGESFGPGAAAQGRLFRGIELATPGVWQDIYRDFVDELAPAARAAGAARAQLAIDVSGPIDFVTKSRLLHGRRARTAASWRRDYFEPVRDRLAAIARDRDGGGPIGAARAMRTADLYLWARHAPERNAMIARRGGVPDGSGMSDADAARVVRALEDSAQGEALRAIADTIQRWRRAVLDHAVESGLLTRDEADGWIAVLPNYVPLRTAEITPDTAPDAQELSPMLDEARRRGFLPPADPDAEPSAPGSDAIDAGGPGQGPGTVQVAGRESPRARGRSTEPMSPLAWWASLADRSLSRGERNIVARSLADFVDAVDDPGFGRIVTIDERARTQTAGGDAAFLRSGPAGSGPAWIVDGGEILVESDHTLAYKHDGQPRAIWLADTALPRAMKRADTEQMGVILRGLHRFTRTYSALSTSWNPEFALTNPIRDAMTAAGNLTSEDSAQIARAVVGNARRAAAAIARVVNAEAGRTLPGRIGVAAPAQIALAPAELVGRASRTARRRRRETDYAAAFGELRDAGGLMGWSSFLTVEEHFDNLRNEAQTQAASRLSPRGAARAMRRVTSFISDANAAAENAIRLSLFVELRRRGASLEAAANAARSITVDFNRRGARGAAMNAAYAFFNASVQGSDRTLRAMATRRGRKLVTALVAAGLASDMLNALLSPDDRDGDSIYDNIPDYELDRNLILINPIADPDAGLSYLKLPLAYGWNVPYALGVHLSRAIRGRVTPERAALAGVSAMLNSFNPVGGAPPSPSGVLTAAVPTVLQPPAQLMTNEDWAGRPIRPEFPGSDRRPDFTLTRDAGATARGLTRALAMLGGADETMPSTSTVGRWLDLSPETLEHLWNGYTGGLGRFVEQAAALPADAGPILAGDLPVSRVPVIRRFAGSPSAYRFDRAFREARDESRDTLAYERAYLRAGNIEAARTRIDDRARRAALLMDLYHAADERLIDAMDQAAERDAPESVTRALAKRQDALRAEAVAAYTAVRRGRDPRSFDVLRSSPGVPERVRYRNTERQRLARWVSDG